MSDFDVELVPVFNMTKMENVDALELDDDVLQNPILPGKYTYSAVLSLTQPLRFHGNDTDADEWVIYIGGAANIAANIELSGTAQASNIYWVEYFILR